MFGGKGRMKKFERLTHNYNNIDRKTKQLRHGGSVYCILFYNMLCYVIDIMMNGVSYVY